MRLPMLTVVSAIILAACAPTTVTDVETVPYVSLTVNGETGSVTIESGTPYTYGWSSKTATVCKMTSPVESGIKTEGSGQIEPGQPYFYPTPGKPVIITIECGSGDPVSFSSSAVISLK